jgi:hypothetical protein
VRRASELLTGEILVDGPTVHADGLGAMVTTYLAEGVLPADNGSSVACRERLDTASASGAPCAEVSDEASRLAGSRQMLARAETTTSAHRIGP